MVYPKKYAHGLRFILFYDGRPMAQTLKQTVHKDRFCVFQWKNHRSNLQIISMFGDDILLFENSFILIQISLKFVPIGPMRLSQHWYR